MQYPEQIQLVDKFSRAEIEGDIPDAKALMLPATILAQADIAFRAKAGRPLLQSEHGYTRALDRGRLGPTYPRPWYNAAYIGRSRESKGKLDFQVWADVNYENIGVAPGVIFVQNNFSIKNTIPQDGSFTRILG